MEVNALRGNPDHVQFTPGDPVEREPLAFLRALGGFSVWDVAGRQANRWRGVTTLIHGNEPSGFLALHQWLLSGRQPQTNVRLIFCNVEIASAEPVFSRRYVDTDTDLNRYFNRLEEAHPVARRASQISDLLTQIEPQWVLDFHNTSGQGPAFAVAVHDQPVIRLLAGYFSRQLIVTQTRVGALMELPVAFPIVTIECGGAHQHTSHQTALQGLSRLLDEDRLDPKNQHTLEVFYTPLRVTLKAGISVDYEQFALKTADLTLRSDIEQFNNRPVPAGELIGWYQGDRVPFTALDGDGQDLASQLFYRQDQRLYVKQSLQMFMATTIREIATHDCLFYCALPDV